MYIVIYYKCKYCNEEFALDPEKIDGVHIDELRIYRLMDDKIVPVVKEKMVLHRCDDHTFGPAFFTYGKVVPG